MRLTVAMLADSAQVAAGRLYVLGGAFDGINAAAFPAAVRQIMVVLVAEVGPSDRNRDLALSIRLLDEDGTPLEVESRATLRVGAPPTLPAGASSLVPLVVPFFGVRFAQPGGYVFIVEHEEEELGRIAFRVRPAP